MSILYLPTVPKPVLQDTDALFQEINLLQKTFGGRVINLYPLTSPNSYFPKSLYGFQQLKTILQLQPEVDKFHVFSPGLYFFPIFYGLKKPVIYTIVAGLQKQARPKAAAKFNSMTIVVSNQRDEAVLQDWKIARYRVIKPGLELARFARQKLAPAKEFRLLMASAPWELSQFASKGIDLLLQVVAKLPFIKLVLLWRGLLFDELIGKIKHYGVTDKIEVINRKVDTQKVLAQVHAAVLLTKSADLVKTYPHSLLEALATGKPVLISRNIAMADYIQQNHCGVVVDDFTVAAVSQAIHKLHDNYQQISNHALAGNVAQDFSTARMLAAYRELYAL